MHVHDVLIIGAGPHGLAMAAALRQGDSRDLDAYAENPFGESALYRVSRRSHSNSSSDQGVRVRLCSKRKILGRRLERSGRDLQRHLFQGTRC